MSWGAIYTKTHFGEVNSSNGWGFFYPAVVKGQQLLTSVTSILTSTVQYFTSKTQ